MTLTATVRRLLLLLVIALLGLGSIIVVKTLRQNETADARAQELSEAGAAALALEADITDYLHDLEDIAAFIAAGSHTPATLRQYAQDTGFFAADSGYGGIAVAEIVSGPEGLAALEARERAHTPDFSLIAPSPTATDHYVLTRLIGSDALASFVGFDLAASPGTAASMQPALDSGLLSHAEVQLDWDNEEARELRDRYTESQIEEVEIFYHQPVIVDGEPIALILAEGIASPSLERVVAGSENEAELRLRLDGEVVAATLAFTGTGRTTTQSTFDVGNLTWMVEASAVAMPDHTMSTRAAWVSAALIASIAAILALVLRNAETAGQLRESHVVARTDSLTGLANRRGLSDELERRLDPKTGSTSTAVLLCDLDHLKVLNDSMGHSAGDESLRQVADLLAATVGDRGLVGRFGGDEFVILCNGCTEAGALELGDQIHQAMASPFELSDGSRQVLSASIGIALADEEATAESLLRDADAAMYAAKRAGRATSVVFDAELRAKAVARLATEQDLRRGLDQGEIIPFFQALTDARTGIPLAVEALARWEHPERGLVGPGEFIQVAEESGLVNQLGAVMLDQTLAQAQRWREDGIDVPRLAVNVADRQIMSPTFVDEVAASLDRYGLPAERLELEISEDLLMSDVQRCRTVLSGLHELGVHLSIDDFGTGRASLGHLRSLTMVSTLKIDGTFVRHMDIRPEDREIVRAIVTLAKSLGMRVVAEGVEKPAQVEILRGFGVDALQGFLFSRPAPADETRALFAEQRTIVEV